MKPIIVHINRNVIQHNHKYGKKLPVNRVEYPNGSIHYCMTVEYTGPSKQIYNPDKPRPCGAKLWVETEHPVVLHGEKPWDDIKENMKLK